MAPGQMAGNAARHARIEDDGDFAGLGLARIEAADGALARACGRSLPAHPDRRSAGARNNRNRAPCPCPRRQSRSPSARSASRHTGRESHATWQAPARRARRWRRCRRNWSRRERRAPRLPSPARHPAACRRKRSGIEQVKVAYGFRQKRCVRQALERIFGRDPRHRDGALGQRPRVGGGGGRNAGDPLADKDPQRDVVAFGRLGRLRPCRDAPRRWPNARARPPRRRHPRRRPWRHRPAPRRGRSGLQIREESPFGGSTFSDFRCSIYCSGPACAMACGHRAHPSGGTPGLPPMQGQDHDAFPSRLPRARSRRNTRVL